MTELAQPHRMYIPPNYAGERQLDFILRVQPIMKVSSPSFIRHLTPHNATFPPTVIFDVRQMRKMSDMDIAVGVRDALRQMRCEVSDGEWQVVADSIVLKGCNSTRASAISFLTDVSESQIVKRAIDTIGDWSKNRITLRPSEPVSRGIHAYLHIYIYIDIESYDAPHIQLTIMYRMYHVLYTGMPSRLRDYATEPDYPHS